MDRPIRSLDGIPFPRFRTLLIVAALGLGAWIVWGAVESVRAKHALMDPTAPKLQRVQAVNEWAKLGREAIPELTNALESQDARTRELALLAIAQIGPDARTAGPAVARLLADPAEPVRGAALHALTRIGYPLEQELPAVVALLSAESSSFREHATRVLDEIGAPAVPLLCRTVESPNREARKQAVTLLGRLGKEDKEAISAVHRAAADPDDEVRGLAYRILIFWSELNLDEAIAGLRDTNPQIASAVAVSADRIAGDTTVLVPDLVRLLDRDDTKSSALQGLWALGSAAESAIRHVVRLLETEPPGLVLDVLGRIGAGKVDLAPHVTPFLVEQSPYGDISERAGEALARISPEAARAAVPELLQYLRGEDARKRQLAAAALDGLGSLAEDAVPALIEALSDSEDWARLCAARALGEIGPAAEGSVQALVALARDRSLSERGEKRFRTVNGMLREAAIRALGRIGAEREFAAAVLVDALADEEESIRAEAALALGRLRANSQTVVPALESALLGDSDIVRRAAAVALGEYGPDARSSVPILVGMTERERIDSPQLGPPDPRGEAFRVPESSWAKERYRDDFPLKPLYERSDANFAIEALQRIDPEALEQAGIVAEATASR